MPIRRGQHRYAGFPRSQFLGQSSRQVVRQDGAAHAAANNQYFHTPLLTLTSNTTYPMDIEALIESVTQSELSLTWEIYKRCSDRLYLAFLTVYARRPPLRASTRTRGPPCAPTR